MTVWQDQPPQTRRQARENERAAAENGQANPPRRAATAEPTAGGDIPQLTTPFPSGANGLSDSPERSDVPASFQATPPAAARTSESTGETPRFRRREFHPRTTAVPAVSGDDDLATPRSPIQAPTAAPAEATTTVAAPQSLPPERTMTRRELRAMLEAEEAAKQAIRSGAAIADPAPPVPTPRAAPRTPLSPPASSVPSAAVRSPAAATPKPVPAAPVQAAPALPEAAAVSRPATPEIVPTPTPSWAVPANDITDPSRSAGAGSEPRLSDTAFTPPVGHWSRAEELDDVNQPFDQIISRGIQSPSTMNTTNALILPSIPQAPDATNHPITSTGEILVTGSIDLPRTLGSTGQHGSRFDSSEIDRLFDAEVEPEVVSTDSAPIRASRAVSSHASTRGVITPPKTRGNRLPMVLAIVAGVMLIAVVGVLVGAYVLRIF